MNNEKRGKDFAKASAQFDGIYAQVAFSTGCEHGYKYAVDKACEWLKENLYVLRTFRDPLVNKYEIFIRMLRGAMEE